MKILLVGGNEADARLIERAAATAELSSVAAISVVRAPTSASLTPTATEGSDALVVATEDLDAVSAGIDGAGDLPVLVLCSAASSAFARDAVARGAQDCVARSDAEGGRLARALLLAIERKKFERSRALAATAEAARLHAESKEETRSRDEVIAIIAHDLRNPLNVMTMTMALLGEERSLTEEKRDKHMKKIDRATARMVGLIDELLDISRLDAKRLAIEAEIQDASGAVDEAIESTRAAAADKSVRIESLVAPGLRVFADASRVAQILTTLVLQAIAMAPRDGDVKVEAEDAGAGVARFTVTVAGAVLSAEHLPRVYERFWSKEHGSREGTGLGLTIARGLVEAHGGRISAASDASGTSFSFTLPPKKPDDARRAKP